MHADLNGALERLNTSYKCFEHRGRSMTKEEVKKVLIYGISKGYKTTAELTDEEVDNVLIQKDVPIPHVNTIRFLKDIYQPASGEQPAFVLAIKEFYGVAVENKGDGKYFVKTALYPDTVFDAEIDKDFVFAND